LLWCTRYARAGQRLCVASILLLLLVSGLPVGTALLLPLENRFPPWDPSHSAPTGIIVLGGAISPEISARRREVSLNSASERLFAVLELYLRYPNVRIVYSGGNANVLFRGPSESEFAVQLLERLGSRVTVLNVKVARAIQWKMPSTQRRLQRLNLASDGCSSRRLITCPALSGCFAMPDFP